MTSGELTQSDRGQAPGDSDRLHLFVFLSDVAAARVALRAGIDAFVVDWECIGKEERQVGADTEINHGCPEDLRRLAQLASCRRVCRVNRFGAETAAEVELAVESGATDLLLPMVKAPGEVEAFLGFIAGRARAGILVETQEACRAAADLASFPLQLVYVGLNDLCISRKGRHIFEAVRDGTVERLREQFAGHFFGFGGVTVVDQGAPLPCRRLLEEMARLGCNFSFLRRSFRRDIEHRDMPTEVRRIRETWRALRARPGDEILRDRAALERDIADLFGPDRATART